MGTVSDWVMLLVTGVYAYVTYKILKANEQVVLEMKKQQEALVRPYVSVSVATFPSNPCLFLKIKNSGKTPASRLRMSIDRDFFQFGEKVENRNLKNKSAFSKPIEMLQPDAELLFYLGQGFVILGDKSDQNVTPNKFGVNIQYDYFGGSIVDNFYIDLAPYASASSPQDPIVTVLEKIHDALEKIKV